MFIFAPKYIETMAKTTLWQDDYWLPLMQIYLKKPVGQKPVYNRDMVTLSLELHIAPPQLALRMEQLSRLDTPRLERIWQTYAESPRRLARAVRLWREMNGFGAADNFYDGVEVNETFERDFHPLDEDPRLTPAALIIVLGLYFQLIPQTMVAETPEVAETARLIGIPTGVVVEMLELYQLCDPYLNRSDITLSHLLVPCQQVWKRFENTEQTKLETFAEELKAYYQ